MFVLLLRRKEEGQELVQTQPRPPLLFTWRIKIPPVYQLNKFSRLEEIKIPCSSRQRAEI